jgi:competence protein ComEC
VVIYLYLCGSEELIVKILDVGQGDATLVTTSNGNTVLIDTGPDDYVSSYLDYPFCHLDLLIITHFHKDHVGGLKRILTNCDIVKITFNDVYLKDFQEAGFGQINSNILHLIHDNVSNFTIDSVNIRILKTESSTSSDLNADSLITILSYKENTAIFSGDASFSTISHALSSVGLGKLTLFMIPHHGAKDGASLPLLTAYKPSVCPISVGENSYGHPNPETLKNIDKVGCKILRTDQVGTLEFRFK